MTHSFFITASGTEIGKTYVTRQWIKALRAAGKNVAALKPVISGWESEGSDTDLLLEALGRPVNNENRDKISPWRFHAPLSPDMAAALEGKSLSFEEVVDFCKQPYSEDVLFIEGVGGAMVPLNETYVVRDWIKALDIPAIVVIGSYLGAMSHALTTIEALKIADIDIAAVVLNETEESTVGLGETRETLLRFIQEPLIVMERGGDFPRSEAELIPTLSQAVRGQN